MRRQTSGIVAMAAFTVLAVPGQMVLGAVAGPSTAAPVGLDPAAVRRAYAALPVVFEENRGQVASAATFLARGSGYAFLVDPLGVTLEFTRGAHPGRHGAGAAAAVVPPGGAMRIDLLGADPHARPDVAAPAGTTSSFTGDRMRWRTGVPDFTEVGFHGVYPGIDVVYHGSGGSLEYDFVVAPGSDPRTIRLRVGGAPAAVAAGGDVALALSGGTVVQHPPSAFQPAPSPQTHRGAETPSSPARARAAARQRRQTAPPGSSPLPVPVGSGYVLGGGGELHLTLGAYDHTRPLVVDPVVSWSPALAGGLDDGFVSTVDDAGTAYAVSATPSPDAAGGGAPAADLAVLALDPDGGVRYRTVLGGAGDADPLDVTADGRGAIEISGGAAAPASGSELLAGGPGRRFTVRLDARGLPLPRTGRSY
jgi:hypothetical protein